MARVRLSAMPPTPRPVSRRTIVPSVHGVAASADGHGWRSRPPSGQPRPPEALRPSGGGSAPVLHLGGPRPRFVRHTGDFLGPRSHHPRSGCHTVMTIKPLPQPHPMPSHPRRRDARAPLPHPRDRAHLRRAWHLTEGHVADAFGVTVATVRSWEAGRTSPTGLRRAAYSAFLSGLAQGLMPEREESEAEVATRTQAPHAPRRPTKHRASRSGRKERRPEVPSGPPPARKPSSRAVAAAGTAVLHGHIAMPKGIRPGCRPDPVSPSRRLRLRAAAVWTACLHLLITSPPPLL